MMNLILLHIVNVPHLHPDEMVVAVTAFIVAAAFILLRNRKRR